MSITASAELNDIQVKLSRYERAAANGLSRYLPPMEEIQRLRERASDLMVATEQLKELRALSNITDALANPLGLDADDDRGLVRSLVRQGWDMKGGHLWAPDYATGAAVRMWSHELVFGALADDPSVQPYQKAVRLSLTPEYGRAWRMWFTDAIRTRNSDVARGRLDTAAQKALSEGLDTAGGYVTPADFNSQIQARLAERSLFRQLADVRTTVRDKVLVPRFQAHSSSGSVYASDFVPTLMPEVASTSDVSVSFGMIDISVHKWEVKTRVSSDLASDQPYLFGWLTQNGGSNLATREDAAFIANTLPQGPLGILRDTDIPTVDIEGSTANLVVNTAAATGSGPKMLDLEGALPDVYAINARWLMRRATLKSVRKLVDAQSRFLYPAERDQAGNQLLMDYPVSLSTAVDADGTDGNRPVILGDLREGYVVATRMLTSLVVLKERYADVDQVGFILFDRIGGCPVNPDAFRIGTV